MAPRYAKEILEFSQREKSAEKYYVFHETYFSHSSTEVGCEKNLDFFMDRHSKLKSQYKNKFLITKTTLSKFAISCYCTYTPTYAVGTHKTGQTKFRN
jgi:hypothetical protein